MFNPMENETEQIFNRLKKNISFYLGLRLELLKLNTYERVAKIIAILSHGAILMLLTFFTTLFLGLALSFFLGEMLNSISLGFIIVAILYLLSTFIIVKSRHRIRLKVANIIITAMMAKDHNDDEDHKKPCADTSGQTAC